MSFNKVNVETVFRYSMSSIGNKSQQQTSKKQTNGSLYECQADFERFVYVPSTNVSSKNDKQELWLIKAPDRFDPKCFADLKIPLSGLEVVQSSGSTPQIYSVLSSRTSPSDLQLLIDDRKKRDTSLCASRFTGVLNISESYGNCSENQGLVAIPAAPAPCIPPGLKQRFQPFGSKVAAHVKDQVTIVASLPPKRASLDPDVGEERRKKKKKKKDKRDGEEVKQDVFIKQEQIKIECHEMQLPDPPLEEVSKEERKKRKKMKKQKERSEEMVDSSLIPKTEPLDPSYVDTDTPVKTKKKKKSKKE